MRGGRVLCVVIVVAASGLWGGVALAQDGEGARDDMSKVFERIKQRDREEREDGFVLDDIPVRQPENDPIRRSMKLSIGKVGSRPVTPFDDPPAHYLTDPIAPDDTPPFGLNLKLKF